MRYRSNNPWKFSNRGRVNKKYASKYRKAKKAKSKYSRQPLNKVGASRPVVIKKIFEGDNLQVGSVGGSGAGYFVGFTPDQLPSWSTYASLYERFKIYKIKFSIEPTTDNNSMVDAVTANRLYIQSVHSCISYLNTTAPSLATDIMNDTTYKRTRGCRKHVRTLYPRMTVDINDSVVASDTTLMNRWLSTSDGYNANMNGLRIYLDSVSSINLAYPIVYNVYVTYTIGFRGLKI